jgi:hypothetical protein
MAFCIAGIAATLAYRIALLLDVRLWRHMPLPWFDLPRAGGLRDKVHPHCT